MGIGWIGRRAPALTVQWGCNEIRKNSGFSDSWREDFAFSNIMLKTCFAPLLGIAFVAGAYAAELSATTEADRQFERELHQLVQQLNDDRAAERDAAEARLLELAGSIAAEVDRFLEMLPDESAEMPLAVRERLARIRNTVQDRVAKAAVQGTKVRLSAKKMPLAEVFAAIEKQTGNRFVDNRDPDAGGNPPQSAVTVELKDEPFWPAIDRVLDQAAAGIYAYGGEDALSIVSRPPGDAARYGRASYSGPFRVELLEVQAQRNLRQPASDSLKLQLEVAWEPRLRPIAISQPVADIEAIADDGKKLTIEQPQAVLDVEVPGGTQAAEVILPFELPPRGAKRIRSLRGKLRALVPGRQVTFRFDDLAKGAGKTKRLGGIQVTIDDVRKNNEIWEIHMRFALDEANSALESHRGWVFQNLSYLEGKDSEPIDNAGFETTRQTANEVGIAYLFDLPQGVEGLTWVYKTPAAIVELPVAYELKNIALP
jgi:hypothetical protein